MKPDTQQYLGLSTWRPSYVVAILLLTALVVTGGYCAYQMEHAGHHITGMNNQFVWGLPHVFALFLVVSASGALNGATMSSVFGVSTYRPYARFSILLAIVLLTGGLSVLVLDLGRPDRLIIAMTHYNFRSIFAWNIFFYTGFVVLGIVYLWMLMERRYNRHATVIGSVALIWRLALTTATGSIFGVLVGRDALDAAIMAPYFIAMSFAFGTAFYALSLHAVARWTDAVLPDSLTLSLTRLLFWSVIAVAYMTIAHHITNLYVAEHKDIEHLVLAGELAPMFWIGHVLVGVVLPVVLLGPIAIGLRAFHTGKPLLMASLSTIVGGFCLIYVVVIGAQSTPQRMFPDKIVVQSDNVSNAYVPSFWEWGLGLGGVALALLLGSLALRMLPFLPHFEQRTPAST